MSDSWRIKSLVGGLVILIFAITSSKGNFEECSLCCSLHGTREDLNCTWANDSSVQLSVLLQSVTSPHESPKNYTVPPGQKWLLIHRNDLIQYHKYLLSVNGGTWNETLNLTYCHGCENVFIEAPALGSSFYDDEDGSLVVEVIWKHIKEYAHPPVVELRYRIVGDKDWTLVHSSDLQPNGYELIDPQPYTDYGFQIRYLPGGQQKSRGLWSDIHVVSIPEKVPIGAPDVWRMDQENSMLVIWKTLSRHSARGRILSYNVTSTYNNMGQTTEEPCCNVELPAQSTHVCVSARNSVGLGPPSCISPLCSVAPETSDFRGKAWGDPSGRIAVCWNASKAYGVPENYVVEWRKDNSTEVDWVRTQGANQMLVLPGQFAPSVLYSISIYALYNDRCIMVFSTEAYGQEKVPLEAPMYSIQELSSTKVFISWNEIPRHKLRGKLKHYTIYINCTTSSERHTVYDRNMTLSNLSPQTCYDIYIRASTAAGEGEPGASHRFCTKEGMRTLHPLVLPIVSVFVVSVLILVVLKSVVDVWPKIPKPEVKFNGTAISAKFWESPQTPPNPPITEVEEVEPMSPPSPSPPPPPQPDRSRVISSGYEKHFMPTPEEVMGLC